MSERALVTRKSLQRDLVENAATKPIAVSVGVTVVVAALVLGVTWLLLVGVGVYMGLAGATFLDGDEAERVGRAAYERARGPAAPERGLPERLAPEIASLVERAREEEQRILRALHDARLPFAVVATEVELLVGEMERSARRAQLVWNYRRDEPTEELRRRLDSLRRERRGPEETARARERAAAALDDRLRLGAALEAELERFIAEMEHLIASLGVIHAQLVRMSVADEARVQEDVAAEVRDLRRRVSSIAEALRETAAEVEDDGG